MAQTNKTSYRRGETITVTGRINVETLGGTQIRLDVLKDGQWIAEQYADADFNTGNFSVGVKVGSNWPIGSGYVIKVYFAPTGRLVDGTNTFSVTA